jgi:hypothetical protein
LPGVKSRFGQDSLGRKMRKKCRRHFAEIRYQISKLDFKCEGSLAGAERAKYGDQVCKVSMLVIIRGKGHIEQKSSAGLRR